MKPTKNKPKCLIFDCDGVLVDSEIITTKYFIKELESLGYQITTEACLKRFTGLSAKAVYQDINRDLGGSLTDKDVERMQAQVHAGMHSEITAVTGMAQLLETLHKNPRISFCLASSGSLDKINKSLQVTQLIKYFPSENIFSAQQVKNGKPAPDLFLFATSKMGQQPEDCLVIEDSEAGIQAALAAKIPVIGFLGGSHTSYDWYKNKIQNYEIPIAENSRELAKLLDTLFLN